MRAPTPSAAAEIAFPDTREIMARIAHLRHKTETALGKKIYLLESRLDVLKKSAELHSPVRVLEDRDARLLRLRERMDMLSSNIVGDADNRFRMICARLEGVNPLAVLSHGYAMVEGEDGRIISSTKDASVGEKIGIGLADGRIYAEITKIEDNTTKEV